jgi:recombination protein RecA
MQRTKYGRLSKQIIKHGNKKSSKKPEYDGAEQVISTGSTLLDLAISGGRLNEGGIPLGILVEIFGPPSCGKTVMLCEIAGNIQAQQGSIMFHDPEARLNKQFARLFNLEINDIDYTIPNTIPEVFSQIRSWKPKTKLNGIFADSLAALSTDLEMENKEGDKMGMRRAKEFSEELRKTCRIISKENYLLVCSNQVRINMNAGPYGQKYSSPGGEALGFYSSLRLQCKKPEKIKEKKTIGGKEVTRTIGVRIVVEVFKSSVWKPYHTAPLTILFDYGIDSIRDELQFIKDYTKNTVYTVNDEKVGTSMNNAIKTVEDNGLEKDLKEEVITLWYDIESKFDSKRKEKIK